MPWFSIATTASIATAALRLGCDLLLTMLILWALAREQEWERGRLLAPPAGTILRNCNMSFTKFSPGAKKITSFWQSHSKFVHHLIKGGGGHRPKPQKYIDFKYILQISGYAPPPPETVEEGLTRDDETVHAGGAMVTWHLSPALPAIALALRLN